MADREHLVYQAKLAEQAERYDGELIFIFIFLTICIVTHFESPQRKNKKQSRISVFYYW